MGRRDIGDTPNKILEAMFSGVKNVKELAYRFKVSEGTVARIRNDFPLFFGLPRKGSYRGRIRDEDK
jgi:hypothetical protein